MKAPIDIINALAEKQKKLKDAEESPTLRSMFNSGYGEKLREDISILKGEIKALTWVLDSQKSST